MTQVRDETPVLDVAGLSQRFAGGSGHFWAAKDVSFQVAPAEAVALVGESGSGKTTVAQAISGLQAPTSGTVHLAGQDVVRLARTRRGRRDLAGRLQMVFQDPYSSLDPTKPVFQLVEESLLLSGLSRPQRHERVAESLDIVGLDPVQHARRPRELSGGQRQRVGIARAIAPRPQLLVLDEPVASLDVSVQGQILQLLDDIRTRENVAMLVIAHDLGVVRAIADRTLVMYRGSLVEGGATPRVFAEPAHPNTQGLLWSATAHGQQAMPTAAKIALATDAAPLPLADTGCPFRARCWRRTAECDTDVARVETEAHWFACNHPISASEEVADRVDVTA
ncbi:oligopeptide/dipeptide ABC transporter ATP-binding protein [Rhizomonospora bruguierae]|uniref:oligopeptide/dipeptide ABC transporter ATP-binding protein n=1 Tax=Rhizomonospora bruguierae TaxID=1581705 RepID=UPI001BD07881|nr:oligopeptide/dipeptide ABC transporter ATP-binding protein [Micromonospora sp. NBRC 107566]